MSNELLKTIYDPEADKRYIVGDTSLSESGAAADAKTVGDFLSTISDEIDGLTDRIYHNERGTSWFIGTINGNTGQNSVSTTRIRCNFISADDFLIYCDEGYKAGLRFYDANKSYLLQDENPGKHLVVFNTEIKHFRRSDFPDVGFIRIIAADVENSEISDASEVSRHVHIVYTNTDITLTKAGYSSDSKVVGDKFSDFDDLVKSANRSIGFVTGWKKGGIATTGWFTYGEWNPIRRRAGLNTTNYINGNVRFIIDDNYRMNIVTYENDGQTPSQSNFISFSSQYYGTVDVEIDPSKVIWLVLRKADGSEFTASDNVNEIVKIICFVQANTESDSIIERNDERTTISKLVQMNRPKRTGSRTLGTPPLVFIHFSDIHGDERCLRSVVRYKEQYSGYIVDILHTGDSVTTYSTDGIEFWDEVDGAESILNCIGNHDTRVRNTWIGLDMASSYSTYFAPYIENWGVEYTEGKTYYYKDYTSNSVRLIVLDIMHQTQEQLSWFESILEDAKDNGLHVICACHARSNTDVTPIDTPWDDVNVVPYNPVVSDSSTSAYPTVMSDDYADAVDSFIQAGGHFICWLHGHTHYKMFATLTNHPGQLDVSVANAGRPAYAWTYVWARIDDTRSEDDFNVVAVDTDSGVLRIMKVGVDYDRYMRHVDTISWDYENGQLLYSN